MYGFRSPKFNLNYNDFNWLSHNGQGLLLCWYSVLRQPGQKPIEKLKLKLRYAAEISSFSPNHNRVAI